MGRLVEVSVLLVVFCAVSAAPGEKNSEDFEFVEERPPSTPPGSGTGARTWLLDPANALCGLLRCGSREVCLLQDRFTAVCVDKAEVARSGDRILPLQKSKQGGRAPLSDSSSPASNDNNNNDNSDYKTSSSSSYGYGGAAQSPKVDEYSDDDDEGEEDDEDFEDDEDEYNYDDDDEEEDDDDEDSDEGGDSSAVEKEGVTEGSTSAAAAGAASSLSPQLDRQPFASKQCGGCPLTRPKFLCGSDNRTYSSTCRLQFHNCIHQAKVVVACKGFCPCREPGHRSSRRSKAALMNKLRATQQQRQQAQQARDNNNNNSNSNNNNYNPDSNSGSFGSNVAAAGAAAAGDSDDEESVVSSSRRDGGGGGGKYGNKKYKKYSKKGSRYSKRRNEVLQSPTNNVWGPNECSQEALAAMGNRMLDWFSVIMSGDSRASSLGQDKTSSRGAPSWCKHEVSWMLSHLDSDGSGQLEPRELFRLEHDDRERCIKPFLDRCDLDRDGHLAAREWCKCFDKSERPCAALRTASQGLLGEGGYIPECDSEGWYRSVQCHGSGSLCWCVDRHGVELPFTRAHGKPRCDAARQTQTRAMSSGGGGLNSAHLDTDDDGEDDIEETVIEGSADMPLDI